MTAMVNLHNYLVFILISLCILLTFNYLYAKIASTTVLQGALTAYFMIGGDAMKKFDFKDLICFGLFLLALLTFIFTFS